MKSVVFVTGNANKAAYFSELIGANVEHQSVELDEIQSMDLTEIATYKAKHAYEVIKRPVLVEDQGLYLTALHGFPGPFVKFMLDGGKNIEAMCRCLDGFDDRSVVAKSAFVYYDGEEATVFKGELAGQIAESPRGDGGFGWDAIFCPEGYGGRTRAELSKAEDHETYVAIKPIEEVRKFLNDE